MKYETRIQAIKSERGRVVVPQPSAAESRPWLARPVQIILMAAVSAAVTYWLLDNVILSRVPTAILGKWEVTEGELEGYTMEFFRNGTMISQVINAGQLTTIEASVHVDDDMLETSIFVPEIAPRQSTWQRIVSVFMGTPTTRQTVAQRIVRLTPTDLVLEDQDGKLIHMQRMGRGIRRT